MYETINPNRNAETLRIHQVCVDYDQRYWFTKAPINNKHSIRAFCLSLSVFPSECDILYFQIDNWSSPLPNWRGFSLWPDVSSMSMNWMSSVNSCSSGWLFLSPLTWSMFDRGKEICLSTAASIGEANLDTKATRLCPDGIEYMKITGYRAVISIL